MKARKHYRFERWENNRLTGDIDAYFEEGDSVGNLLVNGIERGLTPLKGVIQRFNRGGYKFSHIAHWNECGQLMGYSGGMFGKLIDLSEGCNEDDNGLSL